MVAPPHLDRVLVADAVDRYLASVAAQTVRGVLSATTRRSYERDVREFARLVGPVRVLDDVTGEDVDDALLRYQITPDARYTAAESKPGGSGRATSTVNRFRQSLTRFFSYAAREGWVQADPMQWAAPPVRARDGLRVARTALSSGSARSLLAMAGEPPSDEAARRDHDLHLRDRLVVALLLVLGPRVSELVRADVDDFSRQPGDTRWRIHGKGGHVRTVALSDPLADALDDYLDHLRPVLAARRPGDREARRALLLSWRGRRIDAQAVRALLRRALERVPDPYRRDATPHALRHTTATLLAAAGWDVKVVAELLGHASIATTGVYLDRIEGELAAAIRAHPLAGAMGNGTVPGGR
ncbi:tyrosine-type recombinase/integrase [Cellulosimicrobium arenosum]|uniref:Tyrosine-type recombinase/integrase n=1 Tax=Cellulosimicrobium arenosum TaxID=2708133 RepID=A0A927G6H5_9MICO|nr:tyrosine-type recombinase/integrase [Cellulosimicrobium arenosum]MBD8077831.1 tyrosine-type recombinase/integrase [Cellulosimicrobium arenosum]